jgi:predicted kinase
MARGFAPSPPGGDPILMPTPTQPASPAATQLPSAVIVCGPPASGKTTLAAALAGTLRYAIVDLDMVAGALTTAALELAGADTGDLDSPAGGRLRAARYASLLDVAAANLAAGLGVVIAAPFTAERRTEAGWAAVTARLTAAASERAAAPERLSGKAPTREVVLLYLEVPPDVRRLRLAARAAARDRAKLQRGPDTPDTETLVPAAIVLDGTASLDAQLEAALEALATPAGAAASTRQATAC